MNVIRKEIYKKYKTERKEMKYSLKNGTWK